MTAPPSAARPPAGFAEKAYPPAGAVVNAMSVDVEDYYHVQAFAGTVDRADWPAQVSRVERNTEAVLALFETAGVKATFFTLGWVAERHGALVRQIVAAGHELASHGWDHARADGQTAEQFRADVRRAKQVLEQTGGVPVKGYRAATFSIGAANRWAFEVLAEEGYAYSSSVYPLSRELCGWADAPRFPFFPDGVGGIEEYPLSTVLAAGRRWPCAGGGHFRLWPYGYTRWALARLNRREGRPAVFYFHPWEIDPDQPRLAAPWKARTRHYTNLAGTAGRLGRLLAEFAWDRLDRVLLEPGGG